MQIRNGKKSPVNRLDFPDPLMQAGHPPGAKVFVHPVLDASPR